MKTFNLYARKACHSHDQGGLEPVSDLIKEDFEIMCKESLPQLKINRERKHTVAQHI
jgi:hypothetical protein